MKKLIIGLIGGATLMLAIFLTIYLVNNPENSNTDDVKPNLNKPFFDFGTWGNLAEGNNSEVNLLYPADNATIIQEFNFSAEINATGGQTIKNVTLYTNESGSLVAVSSTSNPSGTFKEINNSVGINFDAGASDTAKYGIKFIMNRDTNIVSFRKDSSVTATIGYLLNADKSVNVSVDFTGDVAQLSDNKTVELLAGTLYYVAVDSGGSSFTERHRITNPYPITAQDMNFTTGLDGGSGEIDSSARVWVIENVTTGNETTYAVVNFSRNITTNTLWTYQACDNEGDCGFAPENRTVRIPFFVNNFVYNSSVPETAKEGFFFNITTDGTAPTAIFYYNGSNQGSATNTGKGNSTDYEFTNTLNIPTGSGAKNFSWQVTSGTNTYNLSNIPQTIREINFDICNSTLNQTYENVTFFNETIAQEVTNATLTGTWYYSISTQTINKTFSYTNTTENHRYSFCFSESNRTINMDYSIAYDNSESQQRNYAFSGQLTNITTITNLFLLPTSLGLFSPFTTVNTAGDAISNVKAVITRTLGGSTVTVNTGFTDSSGFITFFLNPDVSYSATFSKSGFSNNVFSFTPTTDTRTVVMGGGSSSIGNGTQIFRNTSYNIIPDNSSLINNTNYVFGFNVTSTQTITLISMNITNSSGYQVSFKSNAGTGLITDTINTGANDTFIGYFVIKTADETISITKRWIIGDTYVGDYSIYKQFTLYLNYGFRDVFRFIFVLAVIMGVMIFMSKNELIETSESKIIVGLLLVWAFSVVGWLNTGIVVNSDTLGINQLGAFSNKYGIAILSTVGGMFFILRRVFIQRQ